MLLHTSFVHPFVFIALLFLASIADAHGVRQNHLDELTHQIEHSPNNAALYVKRGRVYFMQSRWALAQQDFEKTLAIEPNNNQALIALGEVHLAVGALAMAQNYLERYLRVQPNSVQGHTVLARIFMQQKAYAKAATYFEKAVIKDANPTPQMFIQWYRAQIKVTPFNKGHAQKALTKGIAQHGPLVTLLAQLVVLNITTEDYAQAKAWLNKYPEALRKTPQWQLQKAELLALNKEPKQAYSAYSELIEGVNRLPLHKANVPAVQSIVKKAEVARKALSKKLI